MTAGGGGGGAGTVILLSLPWWRTAQRKALSAAGTALPSTTHTCRYLKIYILNKEVRLNITERKTGD